MLALTRVTIAVGGVPLLRDVSLRLPRGRRLALVGPNGAGKTSLLKVLAGETSAAAGEVSRPRGLRLEFLRQEVGDRREGTVLDATLEGAGELRRLERELRTLESRLGSDESALARYGEVHARFEQLGGWRLEADAARILAGLGFATSEHHRPLHELSGGQLVRVRLARMLLARPDVLLLDEPTNHLDLESTSWLAQTLRESEAAMLVVSHDRDFIDGVADGIVEIAEGTTSEYGPGFAEFVAEREARRLRRTAAASRQDREIARVERFVERFRYKASKARQVQSRVKALEKLERVERPTDPRPGVRFDFPDPPRTSRVVVELSAARARLGDHVVFDDADLVVERGEKVAVIGRNGAGKSTLLRLVAGDLAPDGGTVRLGANVTPALSWQHAVDSLRPDRTVVEELRAALGDSHRTVNLRSLAASFGFPGDAADRRVAVLSGGERSRLAIGTLLATPAGLLCLDEPTNHLDIGARSLLEDALLAHAGAALLVSHDRHVLRSVATRVVEVRDGTVRALAGDADTLLAPPGASGVERPVGATADATVARRDGSRAARPRDDERRRTAEARNRRARATRSLRVEVDRTLAALSVVEERIAELTRTLADPEVYDDPEHVKTLVAEHGAAKERAEELMRAWERAERRLEDEHRRLDGELD